MSKNGHKKISDDLAAALLIEAAFATDETACAKYDVTVRTLQNYRKRLAEGDPELSLSFATKKRAFDRAWAERLEVALGKSIRVIGECAEAISATEKCKTDPLIIQSLAGAMKLCADVYLTSKVIDARIRDSNAGDADANRAQDRLLSEIPAEAPAN